MGGSQSVEHASSVYIDTLTENISRRMIKAVNTNNLVSDTVQDVTVKTTCPEHCKTCEPAPVTQIAVNSIDIQSFAELWSESTFNSEVKEAVVSTLDSHQDLAVGLGIASDQDAEVLNDTYKEVADRIVNEDVYESFNSSIVNATSDQTLHVEFECIGKPVNQYTQLEVVASSVAKTVVSNYIDLLKDGSITQNTKGDTKLEGFNIDGIMKWVLAGGMIVLGVYAILKGTKSGDKGTSTFGLMLIAAGMFSLFFFGALGVPVASGPEAIDAEWKLITTIKAVQGGVDFESFSRRYAWADEEMWQKLKDLKGKKKLPWAKALMHVSPNTAQKITF